MSAPSMTEVLTQVKARLDSSASLAALCPNGMLNHPPQELSLPFLRFRWEQVREHLTKDSVGFSGLISLDYWTDYRGDLTCLQVIDILISLFHNYALPLTAASVVVCQYDFSTVITEGDGITHHAIAQFRVLASA